MLFLLTLLQPDYEENPERGLIGSAANIVQIGEFQLLQLAYFEWYDHDMSDDITHCVFHAYMVDGQVPHWAKKYAQKVVDADVAGTIDINHEYFHSYDQESHDFTNTGIRQFVIASSVIAALFAGGLVLSHYSAQEGSSVLPPYFDKRNFDIKKTSPVKKFLCASVVT